MAWRLAFPGKNYPRQQETGHIVLFTQLHDVHTISLITQVSPTQEMRVTGGYLEDQLPTVCLTQVSLSGLRTEIAHSA